MNRFEAVSPVDIRVATPQVAFTMKAGVPMDLNEIQFHAALVFGATPVTEAEIPAVEKTDEVIKEEIQVAIQTILDEGGELSMTGQPKINQVRKYVPEATPALRDEVWETFFQQAQD